MPNFTSVNLSLDYYFSHFSISYFLKQCIFILTIKMYILLEIFGKMHWEKGINKCNDFFLGTILHIFQVTENRLEKVCRQNFFFF